MKVIAGGISLMLTEEEQESSSIKVYCLNYHSLLPPPLLIMQFNQTDYDVLLEYIIIKEEQQ